MWINVENANIYSSEDSSRRASVVTASYYVNETVEDCPLDPDKRYPVYSDENQESLAGWIKGSDFHIIVEPVEEIPEEIEDSSSDEVVAESTAEEKCESVTPRTCVRLNKGVRFWKDGTKIPEWLLYVNLYIVEENDGVVKLSTTANPNSPSFAGEILKCYVEY